MKKARILAAKNVLHSNQAGGFYVAPAFIFLNGNSIEKVEEVSVSQYTKKLEKHRKERFLIKDFGEKFITPAFVNPHTHLAMSFFRGLQSKVTEKNNMIEDVFYEVEKKLQGEDVYHFTKMGIFESLLSGVGFVWDHYYHGHSIAKAFLELGYTGVVAPTLQDRAGPGKKSWKVALTDTLKINSKKYSDAGVFAAYGPHATDTVSKNLWGEVRELALKNNLPLHFHAAQTIEEYDRCMQEFGVSPFTFLNQLKIWDADLNVVSVHNIYAGETDLTFVQKSSRHLLVFCPFSQMQFQFPADVRVWEKLGLNWSVATDCAASNDSMNVQKEYRYISGFPNHQVSFSSEYNFFMKMGTEESVAKVKRLRLNQMESQTSFANEDFLLHKAFTSVEKMHPQCKVGRVQEGYLANFIVWDTSHPSFWPSTDLKKALMLNDTTGAIHNLMIGGEWKGKDGDFQRSILNSDHYLLSKKQADRQLKHLLQKI